MEKENLEKLLESNLNKKSQSLRGRGRPSKKEQNKDKIKIKNFIIIVESSIRQISSHGFDISNLNSQFGDFEDKNNQSEFLESIHDELRNVIKSKLKEQLNLNFYDIFSIANDFSTIRNSHEFNVKNVIVRGLADLDDYLNSNDIFNLIDGEGPSVKIKAKNEVITLLNNIEEAVNFILNRK